jgi:hypothetical protein
MVMPHTQVRGEGSQAKTQRGPANRKQQFNNTSGFLLLTTSASRTLISAARIPHGIAITNGLQAVRDLLFHRCGRSLAGGSRLLAALVMTIFRNKPADSFLERPFADS